MTQKVKEIIRKHLNAITIDCKPTSGGFSHEMYFVKIDKPPYEVIVRFSNPTVKKERDLRKEKYVLEKLTKSKVPVTKILHFERLDNERDYCILSVINGERLDLIWDSLSGKEKYDITKKIGKYARLIHNIKLENFGKLNGDGSIEIDKSFKFKEGGEKKSHSEHFRNFMREFSKSLSRLASYDHIKEKDITKIFSFIMNNKKLINYNGEPSLIHGDLQPCHVFVSKVNSEYHVNGFIDLEFAEPSAPLYDFIKLHRMGFFDNENLRTALEEGYGKIDEKLVRALRISRDVAFAQVLFESGVNEKAEEVLNNSLKMIDEFNS